MKTFKYKFGSKRIHYTIKNNWRPANWSNADEGFLRIYINPGYRCSNLLKYVEFKEKYNLEEVISKNKFI